MAYFNSFPKIYYPFFIKNKEDIKIVTDITRNIRIIKSITENISLYETYDIKDGETPEIISEKFYGTPLYHWVLMIFNDRYDYISDFPLNQLQLDALLIEKYGLLNIGAIHHYEIVVNNKTFVVNSDTIGAIPISNSQYEERINELKRPLKIISPSVMPLVIQQFENII